MVDRLDVGAVIRRVFDIYVDQAPVLLPASAVVFVITGILTALLITASSGLALLALLLSLIATTLFTGMVVELVADVQDGRRDHTPAQLLRAATPVLGQLILVGIVAGVGIVIGFILIIVPGLILITIWSVAAPVVVLERPGVFASLGRSRELVRGNGWQVFAVIFVLFFLILIVSSGVELAADSAGTGAGLVARVVIGVLTGPLSALAQAVLYFDLRRLRAPAAAPAGFPGESSDAAGIAGTGGTGGADLPQAPDVPGAGDGADPPLPA
ncbi:MAG TPA: YciC family protein [Solirubrobacteraceae bacterium]